MSDKKWFNQLMEDERREEVARNRDEKFFRPSTHKLENSIKWKKCYEDVEVVSRYINQQMA
jgi:hypothetical protein